MLSIKSTILCYKYPALSFTFFTLPIPNSDHRKNRKTMVSVSPSRRASLLLLAFLCLGVTLAVRGATAAGYPPSPNCGKLLECPPYTVLLSNRQFEIRAYDVAQWMNLLNQRVYNMTEGVGSAYSVLSLYFDGNNVGNKLIPTTRPFLVDVENSTYGGHLYLPKEYQTKTPPTPDPYSEPVLSAGKFPKHKYAAVRRVSLKWSSITERAVQRELGFLKNGLKSSVYKRAAATPPHRYNLATYTEGNTKSNFIFNEIILWFD